MTKCTEQNCDHDVWCRGVCSTCYSRHEAAGTLNELPRLIAPPGSLFCKRGHRRVVNEDGSMYCPRCDTITQRDRKSNLTIDEKRRRARVAARKTRAKNPETWATYIREYHATMREDPQKLLQCDIRSKTNHAVKKYIETGDIVKTNPPRKRGWTIDYKSIIEYMWSQLPEDFEEVGYGRSPDMYQIDHIVPLKCFDLSIRKEWRLATSPINHRFILGRENHIRGFDADIMDDHEITIQMGLLDDWYDEHFYKNGKRRSR